MELLSLDEFKQLYRKTAKNFLKFISELYKKDQMYAQSFVKWLATYINYHITKEIFNPAFLPSYKQGQIIFVDLGHRVGYEFGMPHYAIVLDADNRKKSQTLTIVPLTSKKSKTRNSDIPMGTRTNRKRSRSTNCEVYGQDRYIRKSRIT